MANFLPQRLPRGAHVPVFEQQGMPNFLIALGLLVGVALLRRILQGRIALPGAQAFSDIRLGTPAKQFIADLSAPQKLLALYLVARLGIFVFGEAAHPAVTHGLDAASKFFGATGILRLA